MIKKDDDKKPKRSNSKKKAASKKDKKTPQLVTPEATNGEFRQSDGDDGSAVDLDAFLLELSSRLVTAGSVPLPQMVEEAAPVERTQIVVFLLGSTRFGMEMPYVNEVVRDPVITSLPGLPNWVLGVSNLHGDILSVIDLQSFLELEKSPRQASTLIVAQAAEQRIGLLVHGVELIYTFPSDGVVSPPFSVETGLVPFLRGAVEREREFIRLLDSERLLLGNEMQQFA